MGFDWNTSARRYRRRPYRGMGVALGIGGIVVAIIIALAIALPSYYKHRQVTFTVTDRERVCSSSGNGSGCKYLIWTNKGVYEDTDSLLNGKFRSSDLYGMLKPGKTFTCTVYGWRSGFFSMYPNLVSCRPAS